MPDVEDLDDMTLVNLCNAIGDPASLSDYEREIAAELERRQIDV